MTDPYPPQQPGPFGPPPGGQQPPPPPYGQQPPPYGQQPMTPPGGQPYPPPGQQPMTPPGGQPFQGGQPPPPPYGQQPVQHGDYPPAPPGTPVKKSGKRKWVIALVVLAVLVAGGFAVRYFTRNSASQAEAGDCIKVNSASATNADVEKIDCNDKIAVFKVAKRLGNDTDSCPTPDYEKYTQTGSGSDFALCLMLNAKEGECFANYDSPDKRSRADCASAEVKVVKVVNGKADETACDKETIAIVYPEPATTYCLGQAQT